MKLHILPSQSDVISRASNFVHEQLSGGVETLGVATGSTFSPIYKHLTKTYDLPKALMAIGLDEYLGVPADHPASFRETLIRELIVPAGLDAENLIMPPTDADGIEEFEKNLRDLGPIGLQLLGIGTNGHIAFNEPGTNPTLRTHVVTLTRETIEANADRLHGEIFEQAVTQGIANILESKKILLVATGTTKAKAISEMLGSNGSSPASELLDHPELALMIDSDAAALLGEEQRAEFS